MSDPGIGIDDGPIEPAVAVPMQTGYGSTVTSDPFDPSLGLGGLGILHPALAPSVVPQLSAPPQGGPQILMQNPWTGAPANGQGQGQGQGQGPSAVSSLSLPVLGDPSNPLQQIGMQAAAANGVPWSVMYHQTAGESSWNPNVGKSSAGAQGISQFIPSTAKQYGVDVKDPTSSLQGQARYMADLYKQAGSWTGALTGYLTGDPHGPVPTSVLRQNPSYAQAYAEAARIDHGGSQGGSGGQTGPTADPLDPNQGLAVAGGPPPSNWAGAPAGSLATGVAAPAGGAGSVASATSSAPAAMQALGKMLQQSASAGGAAGGPWQKLMMLSMIRQLTSQGTHSFTPISYDPFKLLPTQQPARHPILSSIGQPIGEV